MRPPVDRIFQSRTCVVSFMVATLTRECPCYLSISNRCYSMLSEMTVCAFTPGQHIHLLKHCSITRNSPAAGADAVARCRRSAKIEEVILIAERISVLGHVISAGQLKVTKKRERWYSLSRSTQCKKSVTVHGPQYGLLRFVHRIARMDEETL